MHSKNHSHDLVSRHLEGAGTMEAEVASIGNMDQISLVHPVEPNLQQEIRLQWLEDNYY